MREILHTLAALPPAYLTSTQIAHMAFVAFVAVAAMTLTSVQLRVLKHTPPRHWRYAIAWVVCVFVIGALLTATDALVGDTHWMRRLANFGIAALITALGLSAGRAFGRGKWAGAPRAAMVGTLLLTHALIVFAVARVVM